MESTFTYNEFNPHNKNGKPSSIWKIFRAMFEYAHKSKAFKRFTLIYIILLTCLISIDSITFNNVCKTAMNLESYGIIGKIASNFVSVEKKASEIHSIADLDKIDESDISKIVEIRDLALSDVHDIFNFRGFRIFEAVAFYLKLVKMIFIFACFVLPTLYIIFWTHINKWIFNMKRGFVNIFEGFIKKTIKLSIIFLGIYILLLIFLIFEVLIMYKYKDNRNMQYLVAGLSAFFIVLCIVYYYTAMHLIITNKSTSILKACKTSFGIINSFLFDILIKFFIGFIFAIILIAATTLPLILLAIKLNTQEILLLLPIPLIVFVQLDTVFSQMLICDYVSQYEYKKGFIVRDYDYYEVCKNESGLSDKWAESLDGRTYRKRRTLSLMNIFKKNKTKEIKSRDESDNSFELDKMNR